jgi:hypothetical protein
MIVYNTIIMHLKQMSTVLYYYKNSKEVGVEDRAVYEVVKAGKGCP